MLPWKLLEEETKPYTMAGQAMECNDDMAAEAFSAAPRLTFAGLRAKLSDLLASSGEEALQLLSIWVDTLVVDIRAVCARNIILMARNLEIAPGMGNMELKMPAGAALVQGEYLFLKAAGGTFSLNGAAPGAKILCGPVNDVCFLRSGSFFLKSNGNAKGVPSRDQSEIADLICRAPALNALKCSLTAGARLLSRNDLSNRREALSMLHWVSMCARILRSSSEDAPTEYEEMGSQAEELLNIASRGDAVRHVPPLKLKQYTGQAGRLLDAMESYRREQASFEGMAVTKEALSRAADTLGNIGADRKNILVREQEQTAERLQEIKASLLGLERDFQVQAEHADTLLHIIMAEIIEEQSLKYIMSCLSLSLDVVKTLKGVAGAVITKSTSGISDAAGSFFSAATNAKSALEALNAQYRGDRLVETAQALIQSQILLMSHLCVAFQVDDAQGAPAALPKPWESESVDPSLAWTNFVHRAESSLHALKVLSPRGHGEYLGALKILAEYGKAMNNAFIVFCQLHARSALLKAQIKAAENERENWLKLSGSAADEQQRTAIMRGIYQSRIDAISRSFLVTWTNFRNACFYLKFQEPEFAWDPDMTVSKLREVFVNMDETIEEVLQPGSTGAIKLWSSDILIQVDVPVVRNAADVRADGLYALQESNGAAVRFSLAIPPGAGPIHRLLPPGVPVWVKKADFAFYGLDRADDAPLMFTLGTSGSYQNGYGPDGLHAFFSMPLRCHAMYDHKKDRSIAGLNMSNNPVYMTPALFTQWILDFDAVHGEALSQLRMIRASFTVVVK